MEAYGAARPWRWGRGWDGVLQAVFGLMILGGLLLIVAPDSPLVAWLNRAAARTFGPEGEGTGAMRRWLYAVEGSTLAAFGVLGVAVVRTAYRRRERWARDAIALAMVVWFPLDTTASLVFGMWPNAVLNAVIATAVLVPVVATWREFGQAVKTRPVLALEGTGPSLIRVSWDPPEPRDGWRGSLDRFLGPGATWDEYLLQAGVVVLLSGVALGYTAASNATFTTLEWLVLGVLTLDIAGGIVTNATGPAKRWYHRDAVTRSEQLAFVGMHGLHLVLFTLIGGITWPVCLVFYALMMATAMVMLRVPLHLQRPVGVSLYAALLVLSLATVSPATGLAWFLPLFFLEIEVGHLIREAPFRPA